MKRKTPHREDEGVPGKNSGDARRRGEPEIGSLPPNGQAARDQRDLLRQGKPKPTEQEHAEHGEVLVLSKEIQDSVKD